MRCKFGGVGEYEEDDDEIEKRELEESERRTKHSIDGILGDRCELTNFIKSMQRQCEGVTSVRKDSLVFPSQFLYTFIYITHE